MHLQRRAIFCTEPSSYRDAPPARMPGPCLLLSFFSPENLPGGLSLSDVDQSIACCDGMFFDKNTGALSAYAKSVLIANAAWAARRTLVLLLSWCVAFLCSL
jgi:hypothetical protein